MTFEEWLNRPVYRAHVTTARELSRLVGLDPLAAHATIGDSPLLHFRVLPAHRTARSLAIRKLVADRMRVLRRAHGRGATVKYVGA
jgi:hypothetical protein